MAKGQTGTPTTGAAATTGTKAKKTGKKSALRAEIERVAKKTDLPAIFITKKVNAVKAEIDKEHKAKIAGLVTQVESIVANALKPKEEDKTAE